jgi:hypothetical protein
MAVSFGVFVIFFLYKKSDLMSCEDFFFIDLKRKRKKGLKIEDE